MQNSNSEELNVSQQWIKSFILYSLYQTKACIEFARAISARWQQCAIFSQLKISTRHTTRMRWPLDHWGNMF